MFHFTTEKILSRIKRELLLALAYGLLKTAVQLLQEKLRDKYEEQIEIEKYIHNNDNVN